MGKFIDKQGYLNCKRKVAAKKYIKTPLFFFSFDFFIVYSSQMSSKVNTYMPNLYDILDVISTSEKATEYVITFGI